MKTQEELDEISYEAMKKKLDDLNFDVWDVNLFNDLQDKNYLKEHWTWEMFQRYVKENKKCTTKEEFNKSILNELSKGKDWIKYSCAKCNNEIIAIPGHKSSCEHKVNEEKENSKKYYVKRYFSGFLEDRVPEEVLTFVKNPEYLELLVKETDKLIIGEDKLKKAIIPILFGGRLVENASRTSYHLLFSALSGSGKDHFISSLLKLLPIEFFHHKTRLSEKFLSYMHPEDKEPYFSYNGNIIYGEDVNNAFLNCDTTKTFMSGGSSIGVVRDGFAVEIKINGCPVFVLSSATAEPNAELLRRCSIATTDTSQEQTDRILKFQSKLAKEGSLEIDKNLIYTAYILKRVSVHVPFANELLDKFSKKLIARTSFNRLLDFVKASASLYQYQRQVEGGKVIANKDDLHNGLSAYLTLYGKQSIPLTHSQKIVYDYLKESKGKFTASEIFQTCGSKVYAQVKTLIDCLNSLSQKGLIEIGQDERGFRTLSVYSALAQEEDLNDLSSLIDVSNVSNVNEVNNVSNVSNSILINKEEEKKDLLTSFTPLTSYTSLTTDFTDEEIKKAGYTREELEELIKLDKKEV